MRKISLLDLTILALLVLLAWLLFLSGKSEAADTIFQISTEKNSATAFFISPTRLLTAAHTFKNKPETGATLVMSGCRVQARVIKFDAEKDIAVLEVPLCSQNQEFLTLARFGVLKTVGFADGQVVKNTVLLPQAKSDNLCVPGMSGGPVLNESGEVVGMIIKHSMFKKTGGTWITADVLREFIVADTKQGEK